MAHCRKYDFCYVSLRSFDFHESRHLTWVDSYFRLYLPGSRWHLRLRISFSFIAFPFHRKIFKYISVFIQGFRSVNDMITGFQL